MEWRINLLPRIEPFSRNVGSVYNDRSAGIGHEPVMPKSLILKPWLKKSDRFASRLPWPGDPDDGWDEPVVPGYPDTGLGAQRANTDCLPAPNVTIFTFMVRWMFAMDVKLQSPQRSKPAKLPLILFVSCYCFFPPNTSCSYLTVLSGTRALPYDKLLPKMTAWNCYIIPLPVLIWTIKNMCGLKFVTRSVTTIHILAFNSLSMTLRPISTRICLKPTLWISMGLRLIMPFLIDLPIKQKNASRA